MVRKLRGEDAGATATVDAPKKTEKAEPKYKPFTSKEELPAYGVARRGKRGKPDIIAMGEPRYFVNRSLHNPRYFKLIAKFKTPRGVATKLVRVFQPMHRSKDRLLLAELKACGIPGA